MLGVIRHQTGDHSGALQLIDRAIAINPGVAFAHSNRGLALQELRRFNEALTAFDRAVALKPDLAEALYNRANVLRELKRPGEALASYNNALQLKPDYLGGTRQPRDGALGLNRSAEALVSFERAVALAPSSVDALYNSGTMLPGFPLASGGAQLFRPHAGAVTRFCRRAYESRQRAQRSEATGRSA